MPTCCCVFRPKTATVTGSRNAKGWYTELERYGDGDRLLQMTSRPRLAKKNGVATHWQVPREVTYEVAGK